MSESLNIHSFSSYLFWDIDKSTLDASVHDAYIIKRVLEYGQLSDWVLIRDYYTIPVIVDKAKKFRELEERALSYIATVSHTPIEQFRCYTTLQSTPRHWNF
ncbi:hypothetical protein [Bacteroides sp. 51]|uniref:DUF6922 domain-containing protein n=1 Tax=Bacteroides sp. 51 TaxID=2302938 RepID=UPI0013D0F092|nr:hypothetical protein [Bacteroides sp. 51]NDV83806.1 hypothetical protein [Bacteroides sp. 51]